MLIAYQRPSSVSIDDRFSPREMVTSEHVGNEEMCYRKYTLRSVERANE